MIRGHQLWSVNSKRWICIISNIISLTEKVKDKLITDEKAVYNYVKSESKKRFDTEWLEPLGFNNTWALIMRKEHSDKLGINTISDLKNYLESTNL